MINFMIHQIHEIDLRLSMQQQKIYFSLQLVNDLHRTRKKSTFYSTQNTRIDNDDILRSSCKNTFYMNGIEKSESEKRKKNRCCLLLLFLASFCCKQNRKNVKCEWEKKFVVSFRCFFLVDNTLLFSVILAMLLWEELHFFLPNLDFDNFIIAFFFRIFFLHSTFVQFQFAHHTINLLTKFIGLSTTTN